MLDTLVAIALAGCWVVGFFVSAQFLYHQSQIARKLDEMRKRGGGDCPQICPLKTLAFFWRDLEGGYDQEAMRCKNPPLLVILSGAKNLSEKRLHPLPR